MRWIGAAVIAALLILVIGVSAAVKKSKFDVRAVVYGAVCAALSFALSFAKLPMAYGGSITLASMLPLFLYCYAFGIARGAVVGTVYGILQFIQAPFFLNAPQFFLDYIIPFAAICLAAVFKKLKSRTASVLLGALLFSAVRLASHVLSGITFFNLGWIVTLPFFGAGDQFSAFMYSLLYNSIYMVPETVILCAALASLTLTKTFDRLIKTMSPEVARES